jgi:hypothetical protein
MINNPIQDTSSMTIEHGSLNSFESDGKSKQSWLLYKRPLLTLGGLASEYSPVNGAKAPSYLLTMANRILFTVFYRMFFLH